MAGFRNLRRLVARQQTDGAEFFSAFRKVPNVATAAGFWLDLSMSPGNPSPNYYASTPLKAQVLAQSTDGGIRHGGNVSPATKHLREFLAYTATAGATALTAVLCDYLLYYPFCSQDGVGEVQAMDNASPLTRCTSGDGVRIMPVVLNPHSAAGPTFSCEYTNSDGVGGRVTELATFGGQTVAGTILTSAVAGARTFAPFLPLQSGDTGVRSIESVTIQTVGDVGTFALVLVRPLLWTCLRGIDAATEVDAFMHQGGRLPVIEDDAYLGMVARCGGSVSAAQILGTILTTWSE